MPLKPTQPFAVVEFGKDGSVVKKVHTLPSDKAGQELQAAVHFLKFRFPGLNPEQILERLDENDNDFRLNLPSHRPVILELTELSWREYIEPISPEDWSKGSHPYKNTMVLNEVVNDEVEPRMYGIDVAKRSALIVKKILGKLRYAKPTGADFWLLIWTVEMEFVFAGWRAAQHFEDPSIEHARELIRHTQPPLYDEIWATNLITRPIQVSPFEGQL